MVKSASWANSYVGIPHVKYGRSLKGLDCWGLCRLVLLERTRIVIPSYVEVDYDHSEVVERAIDIGAASNDWVDVFPGTEMEFDFVTMKSPVLIGGYLKNAVVHVGIVVEPGLILHTEEKTGAIIQSAEELKYRIYRYKRHKLMCANVRAA